MIKRLTRADYEEVVMILINPGPKETIYAPYGPYPLGTPISLGSRNLLNYADFGLELVEGSTSPWTVKNPDGSGEVADLGSYGQLIVINNSGAAVNMIANDAGNDAIPLPSGAVWSMLNEGSEVSKLLFAGSGTLASVAVVCIAVR